MIFLTSIFVIIYAKERWKVTLITGITGYMGCP
jgi:hypothetical protein